MPYHKNLTPLLVIKYTTILVILSAFSLEASGQNYFDATSRGDWWMIKRSNTYDYQPSPMIDDNGQWKVWDCGGVNGHDTIQYTSYTSAGTYDQATTEVLGPSTVNPFAAADGNHTCAPSVVKHQFSLLDNNQNYYVMYFECQPIYFDTHSGNWYYGSAPTQICVAFSLDGIVWTKYNSTDWDTYYTYETPRPDVAPTPVVSLPSTIVQNCSLGVVTGEYYYANFDPGNSTDCSNDQLNYGVGHPSAIVVNGQIWLYYYSSDGHWEDRGMHRVVSDDGFHFYPSECLKVTSPDGTPQNPILNQNPIQSIRYIPPANGAPGNGLFVGSTNLNNNNYLAYSYDGLTWTAADAANPNATPGFYVGTGIQTGTCGLGFGIFGDSHGVLNAMYINIFSSEGQLGTSAGGIASGCYSQVEDANRGSTWGMRIVQGNLLF